MEINGILLLYHHPIRSDAAVIMQHVDSFAKFSRYPVYAINTELGFPSFLEGKSFDAIVLHWSLFGSYTFHVDGKFADFVCSSQKSRKIAFFQDEHQNCPQRFELINKLKVDTIYTLLEQKFHKEVYLDNTECKDIKSTMTGYVDDTLVSAAGKYAKEDSERAFDIGYRARPLSFFLGAGAQEKTQIAEEFNKRLANSGLVLNIKTQEEDRLYGDDWWDFLANCKGVIGVEAGVSIFDLTGEVKLKCDEFLSKNPRAKFEEVHEKILLPYEDNIYHRVISPRVFEAAAFRTCMILYEGYYSGVLRPMEHYIPLKKDFSNFDRVLETFNNPQERKRITENAYRDLILSGKYSYERFIHDFDESLREAGVACCERPCSDVVFLQNLEQWSATQSKKIGFLSNVWKKLPCRDFLRPMAKFISGFVKNYR